ncbi:MAG: hypothetical protein GY832_21110 [Chloroflexi bacterium]|nr:hypothetical protein [Chloroflexota bacterium]
MNSKQKRVIGILVIANVIIISILLTLTTRPALPSRVHTPTPGHLSRPTLPPTDCQWQATQLLAQADLGGTVMLTTDGSLVFEIIYPLASDQTVDDAAQETWTAFDIALTLYEQGCSAFTQVQVMILSHDTRINTHVSTADLIAFSTDELSQGEFIERVTFTHSVIHHK